MPSFYPDPVFGWTFYAVLVGFLVVATFVDIRKLVIPKKLTLAMLGVGVVFNVVRGVWMGSVLAGEAGRVVWKFADTPALGALDGLLFALAGFAVGFGIFFVLWILNMAGGGDVKMMGAVGAWVGPGWLVVLLLGTIFVFLILAVLRLIKNASRRGVQRAIFDSTSPRKVPVGAHQRKRVIAYSLPVAVATVLLLPLLARHDLHLPLPNAPAPHAQASTQQ